MRNSVAKTSFNCHPKCQEEEMVKLICISGNWVVRSVMSPDRASVHFRC